MSRHAAVYPQSRRTAPSLWEALLLDRASPVARGIVLLLAAAAAVGFGIGMLAAQRHFSGLRAAGTDLSPFAALLAGGSTPLTVWPGWAAALCFASALRRLVRGAPEPPVGGAGPLTTVSAMRAALRREYLGVRVVFVTVAILAVLDCGRLAVYGQAAFGDRMARSDLVYIAVEAAGLVTAVAVLVAWMSRFRQDLRRWGALQG